MDVDRLCEDGAMCMGSGRFHDVPPDCEKERSALVGRSVVVIVSGDAVVPKPGSDTAGCIAVGAARSKASNGHEEAMVTSHKGRSMDSAVVVMEKEFRASDATAVEVGVSLVSPDSERSIAESSTELIDVELVMELVSGMEAEA